jgi:hypothetical protein
VREIELEKQNPSFLNYDTIYLEGTSDVDRIVYYYPLPKKGKYLLLFFECEGTIFPELRTPTKEHKEKYSRLGEEFELVRI